MKNPFRSAMEDLAVNGIDLCAADSFQGCTWGDRPAKSLAFAATAPAVEKMMFEAYWEQGLAILLPETRVSEVVALGLCLASWAPKLGKACGRPITNGSGRRGMPPTTFPNGPLTKARAEAKYGAINHPTIADAARLITRFQTLRGVPTHRLRIWKFDIAAAFPKLSYDPTQVPYVGVELRNKVCMFFLAGVFGLTSMPFAFNVVTQAVVWELNHSVIKGSMLQYVDDGFVVSLDTEEEYDVAATLAFLRALLGPDAVALPKLERAPAFDFLGFHVDLPRGLVSLSERNVLKSLYAFGNVNLSPGVAVPVKTMERLASLASRFGSVCPTVRPYTRALYASYRGRKHMQMVLLQDQHRVVVHLFKHMFVLVGLHAPYFARSFASFCESSPHWVGEFDASLSGVGIIWFAVDTHGREHPAAYSSVDITCLGFGEDSQYQNTAEYLATLLCLQGLLQLNVTAAPIALRGDSVSALTWAKKGSVRSDHALRAAALWAQVATMARMHVTSITHLTHDQNQRTDILSRAGSWEEVLTADRLHFGGLLPAEVPFLPLRTFPLLHVVDPSRPLASNADFDEFFADCLGYFDSSHGMAFFPSGQYL